MLWYLPDVQSSYRSFKQDRTIETFPTLWILLLYFTTRFLNWSQQIILLYLVFGFKPCQVFSVCWPTSQFLCFLKFLMKCLVFWRCGWLCYRRDSWKKQAFCYSIFMFFVYSAIPEHRCWEKNQYSLAFAVLKSPPHPFPTVLFAGHLCSQWFFFSSSLPLSLILKRILYFSVIVSM